MADPITLAFESLEGSIVPSDARVFGGGVDAAAELMDGSRVPTSPTYVYLGSSQDAPQATEVYVFDPQDLIWILAADSQVYSDDRGILQIFAIPGDPHQVWVDFGAGKVGMSPIDAYYQLKKHRVDDDAHPDIRQHLNLLQAEVDSLTGQEAELDDIQTRLATTEGNVLTLNSRMSSAEANISANVSAISSLDSRVSFLEANEPCIRQHILWDMAGELYPTVAKHRFTNLHSHPLEVTSIFAEVDQIEGTCTVILQERDPETGSITGIEAVTLTETEKYDRSDFSHILNEGKQLIVELILGPGGSGRDLTVQVMVQ